MIGIIGAMEIEVAGITAALTDHKTETLCGVTFHTGKLNGTDVVAAKCGVGKVNAAMCTAAMILSYAPSVVINTGVAGGIGPDLKVLDVVLATAVVQHDMDTSPLGDPVGMVSKVNLVELPCDEELRARLVAAAKKADLTIHEGIIATGDQFIHDGATRARIHQLFNALAVEMEGGAVAHACLLNGVKCGVLRSISDQADGHSDMDYPTFTALAAAHSQQVVENLLRA